MPTKVSGDYISVDTIESRTSGFVAQLKERLTRRRYKFTTIFKDHYSDLSYIYLHESNNSSSILEAKMAFESFTKKCNMKVKYYYTNNRRFADNAFIKYTKDN